MNLVIDASVLIKAFVPEILSDKAEDVLARVAEGELALLAPDLLYHETGNILWKKHRLHELAPAEVDEIVDAISALPIRIEASRPVMPLAVAIAMRSGISDPLFKFLHSRIAPLFPTTSPTTAPYGSTSPSFISLFARA